MIGKQPISDLAAGDQFARVEDPNTLWTVKRVVDPPKLPRHAVLTCDQPVRRQIMISAIVLHDKRMYRQVQTQSAGGAG